MASTTARRALRIPDATDLYSTLVTAVDNLGNDVDATLEYSWANAAARTAQVGMTAGQYGTQRDTLVRYRYNGSAWKEWESDLIAYTPTITAGTGTLGSVANVSADYRWMTGVAFVRVSFQVVTVGTGSGTLVVTLPPGYTASKDVIGDSYNVSSGATGSFAATLGNTSAVILRYDATTFIGAGVFVRAQGLFAF